MAVLSFTNCVIDVTIIILCPPFPSLPPSSLSAKPQEQERRDRKTVRLTSPIIAGCISSLIYKLSGCEPSNMWTCSWFQNWARTCAISIRREWSCTHSHLLSLMTPSSMSSHLHSLLHQLLFSPVPSILPLPLCQLLHWATVLFKALHCKIKNVFFIFCVFFVFFYVLFVLKYYKLITVQYKIADCIS